MQDCGACCLFNSPKLPLSTSFASMLFVAGVFCRRYVQTVRAEEAFGGVAKATLWEETRAPSRSQSRKGDVAFGVALRVWIKIPLFFLL